MRCETCDGSGRVCPDCGGGDDCVCTTHSDFPAAPVPCEDCGGTGELTPEQDDWDVQHEADLEAYWDEMEAGEDEG